MDLRSYGATEGVDHEERPLIDTHLFFGSEGRSSQHAHKLTVFGGISLFILVFVMLNFPRIFSDVQTTAEVQKAYTPFQHQNKPHRVPEKDCMPPYSGYPNCWGRVDWMIHNWNATDWQKRYYGDAGVDGTICSFLDYLNTHGFYCPESADAAREKIRGVNIGGWLVLEPWITPSLFKQFDPKDQVWDQWKFCEKLGKAECYRQLQYHWETWLTEKDLKTLAENGINHIRIPVGYWIMGDIEPGEPWITGDLFYLERAVTWASRYGLYVVIDLHCAPGSQNGFDNSGLRGDIHWADVVTTSANSTIYPHIERTLTIIDHISRHFTGPESNPLWNGTVVAFELVNEAFVTIDINVVKQFYQQGYHVVRNHANLAIVIGDSFRFGAWDNFMFPPDYKHVWIDTHIYHVFSADRLSMSQKDHIHYTCHTMKPQVAVAPLSTLVGEFCLATTDCAMWLNGYGNGARWDGTFGGIGPFGSCAGVNDISNTSYWTPEYKQFLRDFAEVQMDAYESGSSEGWFFWTLKTESAPQWDYLLGLEQGWIPRNLSARSKICSNAIPGDLEGSYQPTSNPNLPPKIN